MQTPVQSDVVIVGAGVTGIAAAYYLKRKGIDFVVLEKNDDVGGTWLTLRWPGIRTDSSVQAYAYRFRPADTNCRFWTGEAIQEYLKDTVVDCGLEPSIRYGTRVTKAQFDTRERRWTVETSQGRYQAPFLINANGYYRDKPHRPHLKNESTFAGQIISPFELDRDVQAFRGADVVIIGSGSTAITMAPTIAEVARSVTLLQRSPGYYVETPTGSSAVTKLVNALDRAGIAWPRTLDYWRHMVVSDLIWLLCKVAPGVVRRLIMRDWRHYVSDDEIAKSFSPRYNPWDQRICVSTGFWPAVRAKKIRVIKGEVQDCHTDGIRLTTDERIDCDWIILATGIDLEFLKFPVLIDQTPLTAIGRKHVRGLMLEGVSNYFHPAGYWHTSWTLRIDPLAKYAADAIGYALTHGMREIRINATGREGKPPPLQSNYVLRSKAITPRSTGGVGLASLDRLYTSRFRTRDHIFRP